MTGKQEQEIKFKAISLNTIQMLSYNEKGKPSCVSEWQGLLGSLKLRKGGEAFHHCNYVRLLLLD